MTLDKEVTAIKANAFAGCNKLEQLKIKSSKLESVGKNAFDGIRAKTKIVVPKKKLAAYKKLFAGKGKARN